MPDDAPEEPVPDEDADVLGRFGMTQRDFLQGTAAAQREYLRLQIGQGRQAVRRARGRLEDLRAGAGSEDPGESVEALELEVEALIETIAHLMLEIAALDAQAHAQSEAQAHAQSDTPLTPEAAIAEAERLLKDEGEREQ